MKKTILLFLTSVSCVLLNACYATPEMKPNEYKISYDGGDGVCSAQSEYQHEGLRNCIEQGIAYENSNKKTVTIIPREKETLVIPKAYDDEDMMEASRVYEVVGGNDINVVIEDGNAPDASITETTIIITEVEKEKTNETTENVAEETAVDVQEHTAEDENSEELIVFDETAPDENSITDNTVMPEQVDLLNETAEIVDEQIQENSDEKSGKETSENGSAASDGRTVTFVVGPLKEELVVSVKPAAKTTHSADKKEKEEKVQKAKSIPTFKKNEKEVLPIEEK